MDYRSTTQENRKNCTHIHRDTEIMNIEYLIFLLTTDNNISLLQIQGPY